MDGIGTVRCSHVLYGVPTPQVGVLTQQIPCLWDIQLGGPKNALERVIRMSDGRMRVLEHGQRASRRAYEAGQRAYNAYDIRIKDRRMLAACESQNPSNTFLIHMGCF